MTYSTAKAHILQGREFARKWLKLDFVARQSFLRETKRYFGEGVPIRRRQRPLSSMTEEEALHVAKLLTKSSDAMVRGEWAASLEGDGTCWHVRNDSPWAVACFIYHKGVGRQPFDFITLRSCGSDGMPSTAPRSERMQLAMPDIVRATDYLRRLHFHLPLD